MESGYSNRRVLIADDDEKVRSSLSETIQTRLGCHVVTVASGDEALAQLDRAPFDVIIADMMMAGLHGLELIQSLSQRFPGVHIIVLTGYAKEFPFVDVIKSGAHDFAAKPCMAGEMEAKLLRIFRERELQEAVQSAETKYHSLFEHSMNGMLLIRQDDYVITDVNGAFCRLTGRSRENLLGAKIVSLLPSHEADRLRDGIGVCQLSGQGLLGNIALLKADSTLVYVDVSMTFIKVKGQTVLLLVFSDVTGKREVEDQLARMAQTDELTGLSNRRSFFTRLDWALSEAQKTTRPLSLMFIDIDNFKKCNDMYGHPAGDSVLKLVGELMRSHTRAGRDEGFRYGGDEFTLILPGAPASVAMRIGQDMQTSLAARENLGTSLSIGIAEYKEGMTTPVMVQSADEALYKAKSSGKSAVVTK